MFQLISRDIFRECQYMKRDTELVNLFLDYKALWELWTSYGSPSVLATFCVPVFKLQLA